MNATIGRLMLIVAFPAMLFAQTTYFVDGQDGNDLNTGRSWENSFVSINKAVSAATDGDTIWVHEGIYPFSTTVFVTKKVGIFGGFIGTESSPLDRDLGQYASVVDGLHAIDHCFLITSESLLDGFTIKNAYADGVGSQSVGGGFSAKSTVLTVRNCLFIGNRALLCGGAFDAYKCALTVEKCVFRQNGSVSGGAAQLRECNALFKECAFYDNSAVATTGRGGAVYSYASTCTFRGALFQNNLSENGGALSALNGSLTIDSSNFIGNRASSMGGAIYVSTAECRISKSIQDGNSGSKGAALYFSGSSAGTKVSSARFTKHTGDFGTAFITNGSIVDFQNCIFDGNTMRRHGGAFYLSNSATSISFCTITRNRAERGAGGICSANIYPVITNSIFFQDSVTSTLSADRFFHELTGATDVNQFIVTHSDIDQSGFNGIGTNVSIDPLFVDPGQWNDNGTPSDQTDDFWVQGDYQLKAGSSCINNGTVITDISTDFAGNPRQLDGTCDMGAYETASDITPPAIKSVSTTPHSVVVVFSEPVEVGSANQIGHYQLDPFTDINAVAVRRDTVVLQTGVLADGFYALTIAGIADPTGNVMLSQTIQFTLDMSPPQPVQGLIATMITASSIAFSWQAAVDANAIEEYRISLDNNLQAISTATAWSFQSLVSSTSYIVSVRAVDIYGNISEASNLVVVTANPVSYTLGISIASGEGTVSKTPDQTLYAEGSVVRISATPIPNYRFDGWHGDISTLANPTTVTMSGNRNVTAYFVPIPRYTVTTTAVHGTIQKSPVANDYLSGTVVTLTPIPDNGYKFDRWEGAVNGTLNPASFTVTGAMNVVAVFSIVNADINPLGLQGQWAMDENDGTTVFDLSPNGINGVLNSGCYWTNGISGAAVALNGIDGGIDLGTGNFNADSQLSISLWVMPVLAGRRMVLIQKGTYVNPFMINIEASNRVRAGLRCNNATSYLVSAASLLNGAWNHVVMTYTSGQRRLYINGIESAHDAPTGVLTSTSVPTKLGISPASATPFQGSIDAVRIYNRVLQPAEVQTLFVNEPATTPLPTYVLYVLGENGAVIQSPYALQYVQGTVVSLLATALAGYRFDHWEGDLSTTMNPVSITMDAAKSVVAIFVPADVARLTLNSVHGTISATPQKSEYTLGESVTLSAISDQGYRFDHWSGDLSGTASPASILMTTSRTVTAIFTVSSPLAIIADHTVVSQYDKIPARWIDSVKTMLLSFPGASHGAAFMYGLELLAVADSRFAADVVWEGEGNIPLPPGTTELRVFRPARNFTNTGWVDRPGEEHFWTSAAARTAMKHHLSYFKNTLNNPISAFTYAWSYEVSAGTLANGWAGEVVVQGGSNVSPWDLATTTPNLNDYINAVVEYNNHEPSCKTFFLTGPIDGAYFTGERGYQAYLKYEAIRAYAREHNGVLLDYADILSYNDAGQLQTTAWNGVSYGCLHNDNQGSYSDGGHIICHVGNAACLRLGKAIWWMLARIKGWEG